VEQRDVFRTQANPAVTRTTIPQIEIVVFEWGANEILGERRIVESPDIEHHGAAFQVLDIPDSRDEPFAGGLDTDGAGDGDLACIRIEHLGNGDTSLDARPIVVRKACDFSEQRTDVDDRRRIRCERSHRERQE
jgi:hypothetical protein